MVGAVVFKLVYFIGLAGPNLGEDGSFHPVKDLDELLLDLAYVAALGGALPVGENRGVVLGLLLLGIGTQLGQHFLHAHLGLVAEPFQDALHVADLGEGVVVLEGGTQELDEFQGHVGGPDEVEPAAVARAPYVA